MLADFTVALRVSTVHRCMDSQGRIPREGHTLEHSAALTTVEHLEASPHVGSRASVEDSTEVVSTEAAAFMWAADTGDSVELPQTGLKIGRRSHAHEEHAP